MTGPILFSLPCIWRLLPSGVLHADILRSWRYDPVLRPRRYRDHLAGHLVDFLLVVLDLLHPLPREPLLDAADDRVLPAQEVPVRHEAVDQFEVVPRDADRNGVAALADRLDVRLDRLADQGGAVPVRRVLFEEPIDQLEVLFLEPQCDPLVFVHPDTPRLDRERGMTLSYT